MRVAAPGLYWHQYLPWGPWKAVRRWDLSWIKGQVEFPKEGPVGAQAQGACGQKAGLEARKPNTWAKNEQPSVLQGSWEAKHRFPYEEESSLTILKTSSSKVSQRARD